MEDVIAYLRQTTLITELNGQPVTKEELIKCVDMLAQRATSFWKATGHAQRFYSKDPWDESNEIIKHVFVYCEDERLSQRCVGREIWCLRPSKEAIQAGQIDLEGSSL